MVLSWLALILFVTCIITFICNIKTKANTESQMNYILKEESNILIGFHLCVLNYIPQIHPFDMRGHLQNSHW